MLRVLDLVLMEQTEASVPDNRDRAGDRRGNERRRLDRRTPPPPWRRPWALVAYGLAAGMILVLSLGGFPGTRDEPRDPPIVERRPGDAPPAESAAAAATPPQAAFGAAGFERLTLEGATALGRRVRTELFCEQPRSYQVRDGVPIEPVIASLASGGRVPAAECKWGGAGDPRREDFVLLVPPDLADQFASAPAVTDEYQRRRRVVAVVEWLGRSEALALRAAGVFRGLSR
jgi:hypothetical protein